MRRSDFRWSELDPAAACRPQGSSRLNANVLSFVQERAHAFCSSAGALAAAVAGSSVAGSTALPSASGGGQHSVRDALLRANAASAEVLERIVQRAAAAEVRSKSAQTAMRSEASVCSAAYSSEAVMREPAVFPKAKVQSLEAALSKSDRGGSDVSAEVWSRAVAVRRSCRGFSQASLNTAPMSPGQLTVLIDTLRLQGYVDTAHLRTALSEARSDAETCLAGLDAGSSVEVDELRTQLQLAQEAAQSCLVQMGSAAPNDEARPLQTSSFSQLRQI